MFGSNCDVPNPPQNKNCIIIIIIIIIISITQNTSDKLRASRHKPQVPIHHLGPSHESLDALDPAFRGWIDQGLHCPRPEQTYTGVQDDCRVLEGGPDNRGDPQMKTVRLVPLR